MNAPWELREDRRRGWAVPGRGGQETPVRKRAMGKKFRETPRYLGSRSRGRGRRPARGGALTTSPLLAWPQRPRSPLHHDARDGAGRLPESFPTPRLLFCASRWPPRVGSGIRCVWMSFGFGVFIRGPSPMTASSLPFAYPITNGVLLGPTSPAGF